MKHGFYTRLIQVEILIGIGVIVLLIGLFAYYKLNADFLILYKIAVVVSAGILLFNTKANSFLKNRFPALKDYIFRFVIVGCVLLALAGSDITPEDGPYYYLFAAQISAGGLLLFAAQMGALLDL